MEENFSGLVTIAAVIILVLAIFGLRTCSNEMASTQWNEGVCPKCNVQYELRAIDRSYCKYYVCPECHVEIERY